MFVTNTGCGLEAQVEDEVLSERVARGVGQAGELLLLGVRDELVVPGGNPGREGQVDLAVVVGDEVQLAVRVGAVATKVAVVMYCDSSVDRAVGIEPAPGSSC